MNWQWEWLKKCEKQQSAEVVKSTAKQFCQFSVICYNVAIICTFHTLKVIFSIRVCIVCKKFQSLKLKKDSLLGYQTKKIKSQKIGFNIMILNDLCKNVHYDCRKESVKYKKKIY